MQPGPGMDNQANRLPAHELVYRRIREMILFGELGPGQAVTIQGLAAGIGAGMTPVREAIRRLIAEGALEFLGNRRVSLPRLSLAQLDEISVARQALEPELARRAAPRMRPRDIDELRAIDDALNHAIERGDVAGYLRHNCRFHSALYRHSGARILTQISQTLWLRVGPSLRVVCGVYGTANLPDKHDEAITGLRNQDPEAVARAIADDIEQGHAQIRRSLLEASAGEFD